MIRNVMTRALTVGGLFVVCLALTGCDDSSTGPQGQTPPPETPPAGTVVAPAPGGSDYTPTSVQGSSGAARGGSGSTTGGSGSTTGGGN